MEHRMGSRRPLTVNTQCCLAEFYQAGKRVAICPVRNIGLSGLGIERVPNFLHAGMLLQVEIKTPDKSETIYPRLNALLIWSADRRAGFMWAGQGGQSDVNQSACAA